MLIHLKVHDSDLSKTDILFGKFKQLKYEGLNHIILYAKYYIHKCFIQNTNPSIQSFIPYYRHILEVEKEIFIEKNNYRYLELDLKNWLTCKLLLLNKICLYHNTTNVKHHIQLESLFPSVSAATPQAYDMSCFFVIFINVISPWLCYFVFSYVSNVLLISWKCKSPLYSLMYFWTIAE